MGKQNIKMTKNKNIKPLGSDLTYNRELMIYKKIDLPCVPKLLRHVMIIE